MNILSKEFDGDNLRIVTDLGVSYIFNKHGMFKEDGHDVTIEDVGRIQDYVRKTGVSKCILESEEFYLMDNARYVALDNLMQGNKQWEEFKKN